MKYTTFICLLSSVSNPIDLLLADLELFCQWRWRWKIKFIKNDVEITLDDYHIYVKNPNEWTKECWYKNGELHRGHDKPAVIYASDTQYWYKNCKYHRDHDKPAFILSDGVQRWYKNGVEYEPKGSLTNSP